MCVIASFLHDSIIGFSFFVHDALFIMVPIIVGVEFFEQFELAFVQDVFVLFVAHGYDIFAEVWGAYV